MQAGTYAGFFPVCGVASAALSLPSELSNDVEEGLFNVDAVFGGCLDKVAAEFFCESLTLLGRDFALRDTVAFVSDEHHRGLAEHGS